MSNSPYKFMLIGSAWALLVWIVSKGLSIFLDEAMLAVGIAPVIIGIASLGAGIGYAAYKERQSMRGILRSRTD